MALSNVDSYKEAFYLATMGGAHALSLANEIGSISVGKQFDALVLNANAADSRVDVFDDQSPDVSERVPLFVPMLSVGF